ncbi:Flp1 family type IVb pilin [Herbivorax sp. ANBcel31]|uniref:Flp1 family type IVb pilin n=1 Tax=Herbivorax sp. ANBcel31 TaxID=3069754 RepID=UPI0027B36592|nr:Flp1 family type IVb pilin [Herbivorax sp. ANBcel31]MDQ2085707.1 Flp1 family type IVb pilin [Herbivorax sp. ANBcel31]
MIKKFLKEEDGLGTVEIVIIIAVLVAIALIFRRAIFDFVNGIMDRIFTDQVEEETTKGIPTPISEEESG